MNLLRLCMASGVIVYHSFRLAGERILWLPVEQALENLWVDGQFGLLPDVGGATNPADP